MNPSDRAEFFSAEWNLLGGRETRSTSDGFSFDGPVALETDVTQAIEKTEQWLLARQHSDGHWCAELEGDTILESEYILLLAWMGRESSTIARQAAEYILRKQLPSGGWGLYPGSELEISASVKAYFALKLTGHDPNSEPMQRARAAILAAGGADAVNSFTRFYLALLGQISYQHCPAVPPEAVLLPNWFPINIYRISSWSRTILVPLAIMWAHRPVRPLAPEQGIAELFLQPPERWPELRCPGLQHEQGWFTWERFFRFVDRSFKSLDRWGVKPLRRRGLAAATDWMLRRFAKSDGLGAIFPPIVWSVVALRCLGYEEDSPEVRYCLEQLEALAIHEDDTVRLQPCKSPVWDTALSLRAVAAAGKTAEDSAVRRAVQWLLLKEVTQKGDWVNTASAEPSGWFFEYFNEFYPDVDDTIMVMMALRESFAIAPEAGAGTFVTATRTSVAGAHRHVARMERTLAACERARKWVLAMQNRDGGWGAFDKDNDAEFLCRVPFADHNAMIDPSTPDITARVLECLGGWGVKRGTPAVDRAIAYLRRTQEADGSWYGRWGVNYIYGVWQVLVGLTAVGVPHADPVVRRGAEWLLSKQQPCGGWGESPESYVDPALAGCGPVTASQTAWAILGLIAAGYADHDAVLRGVNYLLQTQTSDGRWHEPEFTGTGFPRVFYLRYHYYPVYFPLLALATWRAVAER